MHLFPQRRKGALGLPPLRKHIFSYLRIAVGGIDVGPETGEWRGSNKDREGKTEGGRERREEREGGGR